MEQVKLYDTTLRDGMGGHGHVALGRREAEGRRRPSTRSACTSSRPASPAPTRRRPSSSSGSPSVELEQGDDLRLRHDPAPRPSPPRRTRRSRVLVGSFAPVVCLVGKTWGLHLEKVTKVSPRGEPGDDRRLGRLLPRARASASVYDAEHFFDGYRDDPAYALECVRAAADAGAENVTLCDTNGGSLPDFVGEATAAVVDGARRRGRGRDPHPQRRRVRGRQLARRGRRGRPPGPGHGQRLRRALRQRQPRLDPARAAAEDGLRRGQRRAARRA